MTESRGDVAVVTGGAGAIGSVLVRSLLQSGVSARVIDNLSSGRREALGNPSGPSTLTLVQADLRDLAAIEPVVKGAREIWHLAANPDIRRGTDDPTIDFEHGTRATFNALEAARRADVPRFLFASSSVVYGLPTTFPTPEEYGPLLPASLYGASKLASEAMISAFAECYGMSNYIFRFANIIGPAMTHGVIYDFFAKLRRDPKRLEVLGDGHQAKSYLRTEDCVGGMRLVADQAHARVNLYNLGNVDRISVKEIAEIVVAAHGGGARIEYVGGERGWVGDIPRQWLAIDKVRGLGWSPRETSVESVRRTVAEMRAASAA
ncbi:MAG TPA: NAD-dependent epimerase/dehydratase family protein [Thermoplasmata archaeon]|nr:NAD-dependent epimerase/dehydratase family protein [Thermoplasmata archaeon]